MAFAIAPGRPTRYGSGLRILVGGLVLVVACATEAPRSFPSERPADFSLDVRVTGGVMGADDGFVLTGHRLQSSGGLNPHEAELSGAELDEIYDEVLAISRVKHRQPHRNNMSDGFDASMVATAGGARYEVTRDREAPDVMELWGTLSRVDHARAGDPVSLPEDRPDDFSLAIGISSMRGNGRGQWHGRIDAVRSYVGDTSWSDITLHPTDEELDRVYDTCRALAASSVTLPRAGADEETYQVSIVAGRRARTFAGSITSLSPNLRALFTRLRPELDAMIRADGAPWPETTSDWLHLEMVISSRTDLRPLERYVISSGQLSGSHAGFTMTRGELDAIYAKARAVANRPSVPATQDVAGYELIHLVMSAESDLVRDSSLHVLGPEVAALREQLAATVAARAGAVAP